MSKKVEKDQNIIADPNMDAANCDVCGENHYYLETKNEVAKCGICQLEIAYSVWMAKCYECGFGEPLFSTKLEVVYDHTANHRASVKECNNNHYSNCKVIGEKNRFNYRKSFCCPCYNLSQHRQKFNKDRDFLYCVNCAIKFPSR